MSEREEYTPPMGKIRSAYAEWAFTSSGQDARLAAFNRAIVAHSQEVREQVARELQVGLVVALREASYDENEWLIGGLSRVAYAQESEIDIFRLGSIDIGMIALYAARIARGGGADR